MAISCFSGYRERLQCLIFVKHVEMKYEQERKRKIMPEYTGTIRKFDGRNLRIQVDHLVFNMTPGLFENITRDFSKGDRVKVEYADNQVKSIVRQEHLK